MKKTIIYYKNGKRVSEKEFSPLFTKFYIIEIWHIAGRDINIFRAQ